MAEVLKSVNRLNIISDWFEDQLNFEEQLTGFPTVE